MDVDNDDLLTLVVEGEFKLPEFMRIQLIDRFSEYQFIPDHATSAFGGEASSTGYQDHRSLEAACWVYGDETLRIVSDSNFGRVLTSSERDTSLTIYELASLGNEGTGFIRAEYDSKSNELRSIDAVVIGEQSQHVRFIPRGTHFEVDTDFSGPSDVDREVYADLKRILAETRSERQPQPSLPGLGSAVAKVEVVDWWGFPTELRDAVLNAISQYHTIDGEDKIRYGGVVAGTNEDYQRDEDLSSECEDLASGKFAVYDNVETLLVFSGESRPHIDDTKLYAEVQTGGDGTVIIGVHYEKRGNHPEAIDIVVYGGEEQAFFRFTPVGKPGSNRYQLTAAGRDNVDQVTPRLAQHMEDMFSMPIG